MPHVICVAEHVSDEWVPLAKLFLRLIRQSFVDLSRGFLTARFAASENELVDHRSLLLKFTLWVHFATPSMRGLRVLSEEVERVGLAMLAPA